MRTTHAAAALGARLRADLPVTTAVESVLSGAATPVQALETLMTCQLESESEWAALVASARS